ncbi:MAG: hypothetical protein AB1646_25295 [Thermodesulfobacteriota bacterium]
MTLGAARVIYTINDLSMYVDEITPGYVIAIIQTERGPVWTPIPVASWDEYTRHFGGLFPGSIDPLAIKTGLMQGAKFVIIRVVHCTNPANRDTMTAAPATLVLRDRGDSPTHGYVESATGPFNFQQALSGRVTGTEVGPFTFGAGTSDQFSVRVGLPGNWGADQTVTLTGSMQTAAQVVDQLNAATGGLTFSATTDQKVRCVVNDPTHAVEVLAVANDAYSVLGFLEGVSSPQAGTDRLVLSIDGGADQTFTLTPAAGEQGAFTLTSGQVLTQLVGLTGATALGVSGKVRITSSTVGTGSSVQVQATSTAGTAMGFDNAVHSGLAGNAADTLRITAKDPGTWGAKLKIQVYDSDRQPATHFDLRIHYDTQPELDEYWSDLNMDPAGPRYAPTYIQERSRLVIAEDLDSPNTAPQNRPALDALGTVLVGGDDGLADFDDGDWIGDESVQTGLYAADKSVLGIDIMVPGSSSITVLQALAAYCEQRGDLVAYGQIPAGLDPTNAGYWRMGQSPYSHEAFNSHRLSLWYGRPLVYDLSDDSRKHVCCLGMLAACLARTDVSYYYHYAPVGPRRGPVDFVEGLDWNLNEYPGMQDQFAELEINYLQMTQTEGAVFWEQRTTQLATSSTQDLNVVRFLTMMRRALMPVLRTFLFEPNHPSTWREFCRTIDPWLRQVKAREAIYDYVLQTDKDAFFDGGVLKNATLNTGQTIDQHRYRARVLIQPTKAIYYLEFTVGVTRTGEAFLEYTGMYDLPGWVRS